ncbi:MAG TPA: RNA 2',3'-cyclic phosphodiesterase [Sulfuricurvum sp.]|nr:RNA 2',3'-cyclic phosphodiesterase [Sulfuricurvum sp.]
MTRLFLAVPIRLYNYKKIKKMYGCLLEGKWKEEKSLHVTIAFLGSSLEPDVVCKSLSTFDCSFTVSELTTFDYFQKSRVFVAVTQNPTLQSLYQRLQKLLELEDTELTPHATLMRVKKITDNDLFFKKLETSQAEKIGILEPKVALYQSTLHSDGARYEVLGEWPI